MFNVLSLPLFAVVLGLLIVACFRLAQSRLVLITGLLWILYAVYEYLVQIRVLCSGECNIRVDLLLIYPVLFIYTVASILRTGKAFWQRRFKG